MENGLSLTKIIKIVFGILLAVAFAVAFYFGAFDFVYKFFSGEEQVVDDGASLNIPENFSLTDDSVGRADVSGILLFSGVEESEEPSLVTYSLTFSDGDAVLRNESELFVMPSSNFIEFKDPSNPSDFFYKSFSEDESGEIVNVTYEARWPSEVFKHMDFREQEFGTLSWSNSQELLAYSSMDQNFDDNPADVKNWDVIITDLKDFYKPIEAASNPVWLSDSNILLYVKPDGIFFYDVELEAESMLLQLNTSDENGFVGIATMFDVSPDGTYMVLTIQGRGRIEVYEIAEETMEANIIGRIVNPDVAYNWPVISPDGSSYAVLSKRFSEDERLTDAKIEVRGLLGRNVLFEEELEGFRPEEVFLDDWIARPLEI